MQKNTIDKIADMQMSKNDIDEVSTKLRTFPRLYFWITLNEFKK